MATSPRTRPMTPRFRRDAAQCGRRRRAPLRLGVHGLEERVTPDATPFSLAAGNFLQDWSNPALITADNNWAAVPSIIGYRGDDPSSTTTGLDPQTILSPRVAPGDTPAGVVNVLANQTNPNTLTTGGVAEFDTLPDGVVALQGSGTADAPFLLIHLDTTGRTGVRVSYSLRDVDGSTDNAVQPVALQYRVGTTGNFVNVPAGFVADATTGPSLATAVTNVSAFLPAAVDNQPHVEVRVITTNAVGNDEWVGVDDISVFSSAVVPTLEAKLVGGLLTITDIDPIGKDNTQAVVRDAFNNVVLTDATELFVAAPPGTSLSNGGRTLTVLASTLSGLTIEYAGGNDLLTVDLSGGSPGVPVSMNGGGGTDAMSVAKGTCATVTVQLTQEVSLSSVTCDASPPLSFTGTESLDVSGLAVSDLAVQFSGGGAPTAAVVATDLSPRLRIGSVPLAAASIVPMTFSNPGTSLSVHRGSAADTLEVQTLSPFTSSLTVGSPAAPFSLVTVSGSLSLSSGSSLSVSSVDAAVTGTGSVSTTGTGQIQLVTERKLVLSTGSYLHVSDGSITLASNQQVPATAGDFTGIDLQGAVVKATGAGAVSLFGRGGDTGTGDQYGVRCVLSTISSTSGPVTVKGESAVSTGGASTGVSIASSSISAAAPSPGVAGSLLHGTSGSAATTSTGLRVSGSTLVSFNSLTRIMDGFAATAPDSTGVFVTDFTQTSGDCVISGTGGDASSSSRGVKFSGFSKSAGTLMITGTGRVAPDSTGVFVTGTGQASGGAFFKGTADTASLSSKGTHIPQLSWAGTLAVFGTSAFAPDSTGVFVTDFTQTSGDCALTGRSSSNGVATFSDLRLDGISTFSGTLALTSQSVAPDVVGVFVAPGSSVKSALSCTVTTSSLSVGGSLTVTTGRLDVTSSSSLTISGGSFSSSAGMFGNAAGGDISYVGPCDVSGPLDCTAPLGSVRVSPGSSLSVSSSVTVTALSVTLGGSLTVSGGSLDVSTSSLKIDSTLTVLDGSFSVHDNADLFVSGGGSVSTPGGTTLESLGGSITLSCDWSLGGSATLRAAAGSVVVTGGAKLSASGHIKMECPSLSNAGTLSSSSSSLSVTSSGALSVSGGGSFSSSTGSSFIASSGTLQVGGSWTVSGDALLTASGDLVSAPGGQVTATTLELVAGGSIGSGGVYFQCQCTHLRSAATGDQFAQVRGFKVEIDGIVVGGKLHLLADGDVTLTGKVSAGSTAQLDATGSFDPNGGAIACPALTLTAGGDIGASSKRLPTSVGTLHAKSTGGSIFVVESDDLAIGDLDADGDLDLVVAGHVDVQNSDARAGNLVRVSAGGDIRQGGSGKFTCTSPGRVVLSSAGTSGVGTLASPVQIGEAAFVQLSAPASSVYVVCYTVNSAVWVEPSVSQFTFKLTVTSSSISSATIDTSSSTGTGGSISLTAASGISTSSLSSSGGGGGSGGSISLVSTGGSVSVGGTGMDARGGGGGAGGIVFISAPSLAVLTDARILSSSGGQITLRCDAIDIATTGTTAVSVTGGRLVWSPRSNFVTVDLGGTDAPLRLGMTGNERRRLSAAVLQIGDGQETPVEVTAAFDVKSAPSPIATFSIRTTSTVTATAAPLLCSSLSVVASSADLSHKSTDCDDFSASCTASVRLRDAFGNVVLSSVDGVVGVSAGTFVSLDVSGSITAVAAVTCPQLAVTCVSAHLLHPDTDCDDIAVVCAVDFAIRDKDSLNIGTVDGRVGVSCGNETDIDCGGALTQTAPVVCSTLKLDASSVFMTHKGNDCDDFSAVFTAVCHFQDGDGVVVDSLTCHAGAPVASSEVQLTAGGAVTQTGAIVAGRLALFVDGDVTFTNASNDVDVIAGSHFRYHEWRWRDATGVAIGTVGGQSGFTFGGDLVLTTAGAVTQTAPLVCHGLALSVDADVTLTHSSNDVDVLAGSNFRYHQWRWTDANGFSVSDVGGLSGVVFPGDLSLTAQGAVTQTARLANSGVALFVDGSVQLTHPDNNVDVLAGATFRYHQWRWRNSGAMAIGSVGGQNGISFPGDFSLTCSGAVTQTSPFVSRGLALFVDAPVTLTDSKNDIELLAGSNFRYHEWRWTDSSSVRISSLFGQNGVSFPGDLCLTAKGAVTQSAPVVMKGLALLVDGDVTMMHQSNEFEVLAGRGAKQKTWLLSNFRSVSIGTVGGESGVTSAGDLSLTCVGAVTQTAPLVVHGLSLVVDDAVTLTNPSNDVDVFSGRKFNLTSTFPTQWSVRTSGAMSVGTVGGVSGVSGFVDLSLTTGGDLTQTAPVVTNGLALFVDGDVTMTDPANDVSVLAGSNFRYHQWTWTDSNSVAIGTVDGQNGVVFPGDLSLSCRGVTQKEPLLIQGLYLKVEGDVLLSHKGNQFATVAGDVTGPSGTSAVMIQTCQQPWSIGTVAGKSGLSVAGELTLECATTVTQTQPVTASSLLLSGAGSFHLPLSSNDFDTFAADATGVLIVADTDGCVVGSVGGVDGVTNAFALCFSVDGSVWQTQPIHTGELQLISFTQGDFTLTHPSNTFGSISGDVAGRVKVSDVSLTLRIDKSSPVLFLSASKGLTAKTGIELFTTGKVQVDSYMKVTLGDLQISSASVSTSGSSEPYPLESLSLNFTKITYSVGDSKDAVRTKVQRLSFEADGEVHVQNTGSLELTAGKGGYDLVKMKTVSPMTVTGQVIGSGDVVLQAGEHSGAGDNLVIAPGGLVISTGGSVTLLAGDDIFIAPGATVSATAFVSVQCGAGDVDGFAALSVGGSVDSGGDLTLVADNMDFVSGAQVRSVTLTWIKRNADDAPISLGGETPGALSLTTSEFSAITAGSLRVGHAQGGTITVVAPVTTASSSKFQEFSTGKFIDLSGGMLDAGGAAVTFVSGATPFAVRPPVSGIDVTTSSLTLTGGLVITIDGSTIDTGYTRLHVSGALSLGGATLSVSGKYAPSKGDVFTIVSASSVTGTFAGLSNGAVVVVGGVPLRITYSATAVTLAEAPPAAQSLLASPPLINDYKTGSGALTLTASFSEPMDPAVTPTFSFPVEDPSLVLSFAGGAWKSPTTYQAYFNVFDLNYKLFDIDVRVSGGQSLTGVGVAPADFPDLLDIETENPIVLGMFLTDPSPTKATTVGWTVVFSEPVTGVTASNFALYNGGLSGPAITGVAGSGTTWTVTASTGTGEGVLALYAVSTIGVFDAAGNPVAALPVIGPGYAVDHVAPRPNSVVAASTGSSPAVITDAAVGPAGFTVTVKFTEAMDQSVTPTISFPAEDPAPTLAFASGAWIDAKTYRATYSVADFGVRLPAVDVQVTGGQDLVGNLQSPLTTPDLFSIDTENPTATVQVNDGSAQRSRVNYLVVTFSEFVTLPGAPASAFTLVGKNGPVLLAVDLSASTTTQTVAKLTFSGPNTEFGSLKDGKYTLSVLGGQVLDLAGNAFDGNGDSAGGDDLAVGLHSLFGDADGDGDVDVQDYGAFRGVFGTSSLIFDFDGDGDVDAADFGQFRARFGTSV